MNTLKEILPLMQDYFKLNKDLGMLLKGDNSFIKCFNPNTHRLHGSVDTLGANTGRCTHSKPNITQLSKEQAFRELMAVPKGKLLLDVDADALELVTLGHYLSKYDGWEFAKIVDSGDKAKGTDIHTINQHRVGLPTRDLAKTFIYSVVYGAGATKVGNSLWTPKTKSTLRYSQAEYNSAKEQVEKRLKEIEDKVYFPIAKDTFTPYTETLIFQTIYGNQIFTAFRSNTKGYHELLSDTQLLATKNTLKGLDGRELHPRSPHSALNLLLQSAGAIYMKHVLVNLEKKLRRIWTHGKEYAYVANIHDAINMEIIPEIQEEICPLIKQVFVDTSYSLGLKYPVYGNPHVGLNQWSVH